MAGLLSGIMYSLVALGFVLIFKASGVLNFAQGAMVFFAALTFVGLAGRGFLCGRVCGCLFAVVVLLAIATERVILRPLVNQPQISLFMATIGVAFLVEGLAQGIWGSQGSSLELGIADEPIGFIMDRVGIGISKFDVFAAAVSAAMVTALALFFNKTRVGLALRAVADDHQAALAIGIPLQSIWRIVWAVAGFVALVAGLMWGARNGVQFALTFLALKALPVLIIGGLDSIPGAVVGGLFIGAAEKLGEVYVGSLVGGGIESWFPYGIALLFLLVRREGLFGE